MSRKPLEVFLMLYFKTRFKLPGELSDKYYCIMKPCHDCYLALKILHSHCRTCNTFFVLFSELKGAKKFTAIYYAFNKIKTSTNNGIFIKVYKTSYYKL